MAFNKKFINCAESIIETRFGRNSVFLPDFTNKILKENRWKILVKKYDLWINSNKNINKNRIPRRIHQIWLGSKLPKAYKGWTESWKLMNPEWEYKLWGEKDILSLGLANENAFLKSKSFGVKSDIARYEILNRFGGVYADTDFECIKSFDELANSCSFFAGVMFSNEPQISNALIGSVPGHPYLCELVGKCSIPIESMDGMEILHATGPIMFTETLFNQSGRNEYFSVFLPSDFFFPFPNFEIESVKNTRVIKSNYVKECTYAVHYWEASWLKPALFASLLKKMNRLRKNMLSSIMSAL